MAPEVLDTMLPFFKDLYGNASSMHSFGGQVTKYIDTAREECARLIGAKRSSDIVFTSGGTESDNAAIMGTLASYSDKKHIVISTVEHPAVRSLAQTLSKKGYSVTEIGVDESGRLNLEELEHSIRDDTAIVSIMWANNETGVIFPIDKISGICAAKGVPFHTDAVQAVGKIPINVSKYEIDLLSVSGHKLYAPKGIGFLYVRRGAKFQPYIIGGHQEKGRRAGTENTPYIVGLGKACSEAQKYMDSENKRVRALRDKLEAGILRSIPKAFVHGDRDARLSNTTNIGFEYIEGEAILLLMNEHGICASSGSACTSGSLEPSHVLRAMKIPFTRAHGSIRFSLSRYNTEADIDLTLEKLPGIVEQLRKLSPFDGR